MISKRYSRIKLLLYEINTKYMNHLRIKTNSTYPKPQVAPFKVLTPRNSIYLIAVPKITVNCSSQDSIK